jgi:hypothetical protein
MVSDMTRRDEAVPMALARRFSAKRIIWMSASALGLSAALWVAA